MKTKNILMSKTFWLNLVAIIVMFWPGLGDKLNEETIVMILGGLNVVLRLFTKQPASITAPLTQKE